MVVDKQIIWQEDIDHPEVVERFFDKLGNGQIAPHRLIDSRNLPWIPPILIYRERRDKDNYVSGELYYTGNGSKASGHEAVASREIIDFSQAATSYSQHIQTMRGKTLDAFCKLEFCIDAFFCVERGVYSGTISLAEMRSELRTSAYNKIDHLSRSGLLGIEAYELLNKARDIRNTIAHQYLIVDSYGVSQEEARAYGDNSIAIDYILNGAWFYLLRDFSAHQAPLLVGSTLASE